VESVVRRSPLVAHVALLGWLMLQQPHLDALISLLDQPVEMVFETAVEPAPASPLPVPASPDLPPEPATPVPPLPEPAPETAKLPTPVVAAPAAPAPPVLGALILPPPRPKLATARPLRPALPIAPAPQASTGLASPAPPPPALPAAAAAVDSGWRTALGSWLAAHKRYPERARLRGDEGTVGIRFTVDAAGRVLEVTVVHSSGSTLLDDAVREMLAGQRVPPFPPSMTPAQRVVPVNIRFQLEQ